MGAATLVLTESLRGLIERQRGTSASRTAAQIRRRSNQDEVRKSGHQSRSRRAPSDFARSEEHTSELQSLMRISYAVFCLKKKKNKKHTKTTPTINYSPHRKVIT